MFVQTDYPKMFVLEDQVYFDRQRRVMYTPNAQVELKENEARLLSALLAGVQDKRMIIEILWESRGVIVTENNYYKVVKGLRNAFDSIGLSADLLKTLPRVGLAYVGSSKPLAADETRESPLVASKPSEIFSRIKDVRLGLKFNTLLLAAILFLALLCGRLLLLSDNGFRLLGAKDGVRVFVYQDPGMSFDDILSRYRQFLAQQQAMHDLYYREIGKNYVILACPTALPDGAESCVSLMQKNI